MNDQRTIVVLALWAAACGWFVAVSLGDNPYPIGAFVLLAIATAGLAWGARRSIVVVAPLLLSPLLGFWAATVACPCAGSSGLEVVLVWVAVFGVGGGLVAAISLMVVWKRHPADHHPPIRLDRPV